MQSTKNGPWLDASHCDTQGAQQESPLPAIGAFEQCCSNSRKTAANAAGAPPRTQRHGRDIPGGWSRSGAPHSRSARANVVMSDDRECRGNEPAERTDWLYADGGARPRAGAAGQSRVGRDRRWGCLMALDCSPPSASNSRRTSRSSASTTATTARAACSRAQPRPELIWPKRPGPVHAG